MDGKTSSCCCAGKGALLTFCTGVTLIESRFRAMNALDNSLAIGCLTCIGFLDGQAITREEKEKEKKNVCLICKDVLIMERTL